MSKILLNGYVLISFYYKISIWKMYLLYVTSQAIYVIRFNPFTQKKKLRVRLVSFWLLNWYLSESETSQNI